MKNLIVFFLLMVCMMNIKAQISVTNNGILYVNNSADIVAVSGSFTNSASASLTNKGQLYIKQNLTNSQASMTASTGTLFLNGTSAQAIGGTEVFKTYHLVTNNSAGIVLNNNLSVSGTHTFINGIITSSATPNYLVYESGSGYTGESDNAHVNGWIKKYGSTNFIFPTGNASFLRTILIKNISTASEFNVAYSGTIPNPTLVQSPLQSTNLNEHWTVNKISGGTAQVQLNWDDSKINFPDFILADIRAAAYSGSQWMNAGGSALGDVGTTGTITSSVLSTFGRMGIGSISFVISLNFINISAVRNSAGATIHWQTTNELNLDHYEIQRSTDGNMFTTAGITGARNNSSLQSYAYFDAGAPLAKLFYRVKSVDADGSVKLTRIVSIQPVEKNRTIKLLNNPVTKEIRLGLENPSAGSFIYQLMNDAGQVIQTGSFQASFPVITIPLRKDFPKGIYTLSIFQSDQVQSMKLIIR